jgi:hypothetical protein
MENTHEHLEHIEHTQHAAHDPFNRNVAMTMAIVAAALACVTLLSHREHNRTLQLQAEGNNLKTEAAILQTEADTLKTEGNSLQTKAADEWAFYQAKNIRRHEYEAYLRLLAVLAKDPGAESEKKQLEADWRSKVAQYDKELQAQMSKARGLEEGAQQKVEKAEAKLTEAEHKQEHSEKKIEESHHAHHRGDGFDLSELAVELALVLCSIAVLTRRATFWYSGMICGAIGVLVAIYVFFLMH